MKRRISLALAVFSFLAQQASAHFPFIVPSADGKSAKIVMSETLEPDPKVPISLLEKAAFSVRDASGKESTLAATTAEHELNAELSGDGARVIHGTIDLGIQQRKGGPSHLLIYHAKSLVGDAFSASSTLGEATPIEITPVRVENGMKLQLTVNGAKTPDAPILVIKPDGLQEELFTDAQGLTPILKEEGTYGAWARNWIDSAGERDAKAYTQIRHYATLVMRLDRAPSSQPVPIVSGAPVRVLPPLPQRVSSFGACLSDGYLYLYGGHTADRHEYSTAAVSGAFHRMSLEKPGAWETLPGGPSMQGMNLIAHKGLIYRFGGMLPRNAPGEPKDIVSLATVARFDPTRNQWDTLPDLPSPRSSYDVALVDDTLYIIGGWNMLGGERESEWTDTIAMLDLKGPQAKWESIPQPFKRRALIVASLGSKIFVIGGIDEDDEIASDVEIYDAATKVWTSGPALPGKSMNGFSPAACVLEGRLYVSVADGSVLRLSPDERSWETLAKTTPRIVHRMIGDSGRLLLLGGATGREMTDLVECVELRTSADKN